MMRVLFAASELNPLAKVGGLADVAAALPKALKKLGVDVRVVLPYYEQVHQSTISAQKLDKSLTVTWAGKPEPVTVYETTIPDSDVPLILLDHAFLNQGPVYPSSATAVTSQPEIDRFAFFSLTIVEGLRQKFWQADILHCNDWHVSLVPLLTKASNVSTPTLLTIHNLALQGVTDPSVLDRLGLERTATPTLAADLKEDGLVTILRQGLECATKLNTVSPTYAKEITTPEFGEGLEKVLRRREADLAGILNGIDVEALNPETDSTIAARYSKADLAGKTVCKAALQRACGFAEDPNAFLLGSVGRVSDQKGIELILEIIPELAKANLQLVVLGAGSELYERGLLEAARIHPKQVFVRIGFDARFAQAIYAGSDAFLMPSRFEPCGLGQMIAMCYGTVPIVRATGGLKDTVIDATTNPTTGTGFVFEPYRANEFLAAINRAFRVFADQPRQWYTLRERDMTVDFSWERSSKEYVGLYERVLHT